MVILGPLHFVGLILDWEKNIPKTVVVLTVSNYLGKNPTKDLTKSTKFNQAFFLKHSFQYK